MRPEFLLFAATYASVLVCALVGVVRTRRWAAELAPEVLKQRVKYSAAMLHIFAKVLRATMLNVATLVILLSLVTTSIVAAMAYGEARTVIVKTIDEEVPGHLSLVKLSQPLKREDVESLLKPLLSKASAVTYLYRATLERGIRVGGLPEAKWIVIGVDGALAERLNLTPDTLVTGCGRGGPHALTESGIGIRCAKPNLKTLRIAPLETLLPVLGYVATEPVTPQLDMVILSDMNTLARVLNAESIPVTDVLIEGVPLSWKDVSELLEVPNVDVLYYYHSSTVIVAGSASVMTASSVVSTLLTVLSCAAMVTIAYRSLVPEFKSIYEKLHYIGLPQWGAVVCVLMHMLVLASLGTAASALLAYRALSAKQATISAVVSLLSISIAAVGLVKEMGAGTLSYGAYTPVVERCELIIPLQKLGSVDRLVEVIKEAAETNEFFEIESFSYRSWNGEVVVYFRAVYREMWGIALSGLVGITPTDGMVRVFIEADVTSVEEISEGMYNSIRALFISKLMGKLKLSLGL